MKLIVMQSSPFACYLFPNYVETSSSATSSRTTGNVLFRVSFKFQYLDGKQSKNLMTEKEDGEVTVESLFR
jgi:hypothetical protein